MLTIQHAARFADIALGHVTQEFPNKLDQVLTGPGDLAAPSVLHPIFYGSFDWHSCVHSYWLLARLSRRYPGLPQGEHIRRLFTSAFTPEHVSAELEALRRPYGGTFERPFGWAWLLMLVAELARHQGAEAPGGHAASVAPLAEAFAGRLLAYLPKATYPVRTGVHSNTAFALALALEYASVAGRPDLSDAIVRTGRRWYLPDRDCQAWEPGGEDFLSPCLIEAECMRRLLSPEEFDVWFAMFLPRVALREPVTLFQPVTVSDRSDGRIAHLDGLNLSRAWCWNNLAAAVPAADPRRVAMVEAARRHLDASLDSVAGDYMGEHWLATFAVLALESG